MTNWARLAELRKAAGFTQEELAAEIGVSRPHTPPPPAACHFRRFAVSCCRDLLRLRPVRAITALTTAQEHEDRLDWPAGKPVLAQSYHGRRQAGVGCKHRLGSPSRHRVLAFRRPSAFRMIVITG
ncbi:MAG: helix-turn-helix transcriptional regulator [Deltaproteobacteria bacterium]|nr:helix-turn-helix transcriptional regulator [Deltaproteobacteria bacterium]